MLERLVVLRQGGIDWFVRVGPPPHPPDVSPTRTILPGVPKLPTWAGVRGQATAATIAAALWKNLTASGAHGRRAALFLLLWINDWRVLERRGWVRADPTAD